MAKTKGQKRSAEYVSDDGFVEDAGPSSKKQKYVVSGETQRDDEGNEYWELSGKRRVTVQPFNKMTMVNIREYYEQDGKTKPGKKGIHLTMEQYAALINVMPQIERALSAKGEKVPRPVYDGEPPADKEDAVEEEGGAESEEEEAEEKEEPALKKGKLDRFKPKKNHEATSDEDEGD